MRPNRSSLRRALLPAGVFATVLGAHYVWLGLFPEQDPAQAGWAVLPSETSWLQTYLETQAYWLGYCYALSAAFAADAVRNYLSDQTCASRNIALGSLTFSGFFAVAGCFVIGCCGSPMLVVWLTLFGAAFLPFAKPLVAGLATISIAIAWWWMGRSRRNRQRMEGIATLGWETRRSV